MLEINKKCKTRKGETVTPFLIQDNNVYCINKYGSTIIKNIKDFVVNERKKIPKIVSVVPVPKEDTLFQDEPVSNELVAEEITNELVTEEKTEELVKEEITDGFVVIKDGKDNINAYPEDDDYI